MPFDTFFLLPWLLMASVSAQVSHQQLYPEQLQQQQLQFKQTAIQAQIQELQRQFLVNQDNGVAYNSLMVRQNELFRELQEINRQMLELQQALTDRMGGGHKYGKPGAVSDLPTNFIDKRIKPQARPSIPVCVNGGSCQPLVICASSLEGSRDPLEGCQLPGGEAGICCAIVDPVSASRRTRILTAPPPPPVIVPIISPQQINASVRIALGKVDERRLIASDLLAKRILVESGSAAAWHQELFPTSNETLNVGEMAQKSVEASVELVNDFNLSPDQGRFALPKFSILDTVLADTCPKQAFCRAHKYRSTDGSCNNLQHQRWGATGTALQRILPPKYVDGVNSPRTQSDEGFPLPSARVVSVRFAQAKDSSSDKYTLLLMQWGQFIDHDITHTPISRGQSGFGISCCRDGKVIDRSLRHPDCFPIEIPVNDHMFGKFGQQCMEFVRSLPAPRPECNFGPREQMNQITSYLDGSGVYSSFKNFQRGLREFRGGRLQVQNFRGKQMLPANAAECSDNLQNLACFSAGDGRVNEQIDLALIHTIWMREHNRIAGILSQMHPNWSDEAIFQETRRIIIAEIQHITYNEFLPIILGNVYMEKAELSPKQSGWTQMYDSTVNAGITNVFASAAFRFGHTLIQDSIHGYGKFGNIRENLQLSKQHFAPFLLYRDEGLDDFVRGLSFQSSQNFDRFFSKQITDHLFQGNLDFGLDLVAMNIQRARDHGIAPYNEWREVCGLRKAAGWEDLLENMDRESVELLTRIYNDVDEVDLFVAGVAERPLPGALLGPTFACLVGDQFSRFRRGDRFFYEEAGQPSSFSQQQLDEIRKVNLARLLCDNSDNIVLMQPLAFLKPTVVNQRISCDSPAIPKMNLEAWRNEISAVP